MRGDEIIAAAGSAELLAEVGCDHAKLTELALMRGVCKRAVVSDISAVCLKKAERTLARFGDKVTYVVADGVPKEAESADVNGDGIADTKHAASILQYAAEHITKF